MKIVPVNYESGEMALEIVAETPIEYMVLAQIWKNGEMTRGNGSTTTPTGMATGFYLHCTKKDK